MLVTLPFLLLEEDPERDPRLLNETDQQGFIEEVKKNPAKILAQWKGIKNDLAADNPEVAITKAVLFQRLLKTTGVTPRELKITDWDETLVAVYAEFAVWEHSKMKSDQDYRKNYTAIAENMVSDFYDKHHDEILAACQGQGMDDEEMAYYFTVKFAARAKYKFLLLNSWAKKGLLKKGAKTPEMMKFVTEEIDRANAFEMYKLTPEAMGMNRERIRLLQTLIDANLTEGKYSLEDLRRFF